MPINLVKGQKIDLTKDYGLTKLRIGLGWSPAGAEEASRKKGLLDKISHMTSVKHDIDIDASVILLQNDKFVNGDDLVYYGNTKHYSGAVKHSGDNLTGEGEGDDETIYTDLSKVPSKINRLVYIVNIYSCRSRKQHFGMIADAYIKVYDDNTGKVICQYNLSDDYDGYTGIYVGEIYRHDDSWKFSALGDPCKANNIDEMIRQYR